MLQTGRRKDGFRIACVFGLWQRARSWPDGSSVRYAARYKNSVLVVNELHNGPGAPQARPPEQRGEGPPRAMALGSGGRSPRSRQTMSARYRI